MTRSRDRTFWLMKGRVIESPVRDRQVLKGVSRIFERGRVGRSGCAAMTMRCVSECSC